MIDYSKIYTIQSLDGEVWKDILGYEGLYQVSNLGRVKSLEREVFNALLNRYLIHPERILRSSKGVQGRYLSVRLSKEGKGKSKSVHRLVAEAFIPNVLNKPQIDHINANKFDNRVENLRWVTAKENCNNPLRIELFKGENNHYYGKKHTLQIREKISKNSSHKKQVINITTGVIFNSLRKAAESCHSSHSQIKIVINKQLEYKSCYWRFYESK